MLSMFQKKDATQVPLKTVDESLFTGVTINRVIRFVPTRVFLTFQIHPR